MVGSNSVASKASGIAKLASCPDLDIPNGWAAHEAVSTCAIDEQVVGADTREARYAGWPIAGGTARIAVCAAVVPSVFVLVSVAGGDASRVGGEEVGAIDAGSTIGCAERVTILAGLAAELDWADLAFASGRVGIEAFGTNGPAHLQQQVGISRSADAGSAVFRVGSVAGFALGVA